MSEAHQPVSAKSLGRGHLAVLAIFTLAIVAATFAWYVNFNRGRRALQFFGPEAATLIRTAPEVELLGGPNGNIDISKAQGLLHARTALLNDASYQWTVAEVSAVGEPKYAVRFSADEKSVDVCFDFDNGAIAIACGTKRARLTKKTAEGWRAYVERQLNAPRPLTARPSR